MGDIKKLNDMFNEYHELQVNHERLGWVLYTAGYDFGVEKEYEKIVELLKSKENYELVLQCMKLELSPEDRRRVEIVHNIFSPYHLSDELNQLDSAIQKKENELSKVLNTFRYHFEGKEISSVEIEQILSTDSNRERRKAAYFARNQINKPMVDAGFVELIKLRKEYARQYGADSFISYKLEQAELDKDTFDTWVSQLHELLPKMKEERGAYAREFLNDDVIMPWDEAYVSARIAPSLNKVVDMSNYYSNIKELFELFGIDISKFNITYDIFPRANKSEWGYNFPIETAKDSRILANVKNKFYEYNVLLHETGHGVHSFLLDPDEKILNEGVSGIISEGIANLFQSFIDDPAFFSKFFEDADKTGEEFRKLKAFKKVNALRAINRIFFDHSFYKNDVESLDDIYALYWKTYKEVLKEEPFGTEPPWAFTIHHTTHPIYLHNYFMGTLTCEMLGKVFKEKYGAGMTEKPAEFGEFLIKEVIKSSGRYKYNDLFKKISGKDFSLKYMLEE
jgi:oligoendopeptidase F